MKLPFSFSLKFVFRILFPGLVVTLALFPALRALCDSLYTNIQSSHIIILSTIMAGWAFIVLDMHIYMALEGRRYWPRWLQKLFLRAEVWRLSRLRKKYNSAKETNRVKYIEISVELRRFPLNDDGEHTAIYPTRLGNLLTAYEEYPLRAYGMDSVFYWYRIWLAVDEDLREHIDNQQALADSSVYMTVSLFIAGLIMIVYAALQKMCTGWINMLPEPQVLIFIGFISLVFSYLIYRTSLHLHASFGELYKSMFDIHRDKVSVDKTIDLIANLTKDDTIKNSSSSEKYMATWRYLHNYKIKTKKGVVSAATLPHDD